MHYVLNTEVSREFHMTVTRLWRQSIKAHNRDFEPPLRDGEAWGTSIQGPSTTRMHVRELYHVMICMH